MPAQTDSSQFPISRDCYRSAGVWSVSFILMFVILTTASIGSASATAQQPDPSPPVTTPAPAPPINNDPSASTWSASPTGGTDANLPDNRTNFSYELAPGAEVEDSATVWNYTDQPRLFEIYARDAYATPAGGIDMLTKDKGATDSGTWIGLATDRVEVPPRSGVMVPFTLRVPAKATPGDHDAGILVSQITAEGDPNARKVKIDNRLGLRVYTRVSGPLNPALTVENIVATYSGTPNPAGRGEVEVTYTVHNTGNVRLKGGHTVDLSGIFGWNLAQATPAELPELLPDAKVTHTERFGGVAPALRLTASVTITPFPPKGPGKQAGSIEPTTVEASTWAVPWTLLLIFAAAIGLWRLRRRLHRRVPEPAATSKGKRTFPTRSVATPAAATADNSDGETGANADDARDHEEFTESPEVGSPIAAKAPADFT